MTELLSLHSWYPKWSGSSPKSNTNKKVPATQSRRLFRAKSSNALSETVLSSNTLTSTPRIPSPLLEGPSENSLSTLRDPRTTSAVDSSLCGNGPHHPELSDEVATLSDKLIKAINNQTILDDTLAATRQELEHSRSTNLQLELVAKQYEEDFANGVYVRRADSDAECERLQKLVEKESADRFAIESEKQEIEQELENLTAALFEEANKMVSIAKKERQAAERRSEQFKAQIADTEAIVASQQEQLAELKSVMQGMQGDQEEADSRRRSSSAAFSFPVGFGQQNNNISQALQAMNLNPNCQSPCQLSPGPSTSFSPLINTVCRTDLPAFDDFRSMLDIFKTARTPSRLPSSSYVGLGIGSITGHSHNVSNGSATSVNSAATNTSSPRENNVSYNILKETRFYKRVLTEDIEPTLRLDNAPGISWLTRRTVLGAICDGGLVIEPLPSMSQSSLSCAMCGEHHQMGDNPRTHCFRTSDNENAQRYPLCMLCLEKMRSSCQLVGYLRLIVDGHIRIHDTDEEKEAWEETVRLRERMFWSRMGAGVVPTFIQTPKQTPTIDNTYAASIDTQDKADDRKKTPSPEPDDIIKFTGSPNPGLGRSRSILHAKRISIGNNVIDVKRSDQITRTRSPQDGAEGANGCSVRFGDASNGNEPSSKNLSYGSTTEVTENNRTEMADRKSWRMSIPGAFS